MKQKKNTLKKRKKRAAVKRHQQRENPVFTLNFDEKSTFRVPDRVLGEDVSGFAKTLYMYSCVCAQNENFEPTTLANAAVNCGMSIAEAVAARRELEELGVIEVSAQFLNAEEWAQRELEKSI
jgi:hypothetical protein